jgi:hypothetical protein
MAVNPRSRQQEPTTASSRSTGPGLVHAVDGAGDAVCRGQIDPDDVDELRWAQVPPERRCPACHVTMGAIG